MALVGRCRHEVRDERARAMIIEGNIRLVSVGERGCGKQKETKGGCHWTFRGMMLVRNGQS